MKSVRHFLYLPSYKLDFVAGYPGWSQGQDGRVRVVGRRDGWRRKGAGAHAALQHR